MRKVLLLLSLYLFIPSLVLAQVEATDRKNVFSSDSKELKKEEKKTATEILKRDKGTGNEIQFNAPRVEFLKDSNEFKGSGGVVITKEGLTLEADEGRFNSKSKDSELSGKVHLAIEGGDISADDAKFNLESETGTFGNADFILDQGNYKVTARQADKVSERELKLFDTTFTTCHCGKENAPWSIDCDDADITEDGYAYTHGTTMAFYGVPFFYSPYFAFPVNQERRSGLLVPSIGYGSEDGFLYKQPIFAVIDDSTDLVASPFIETKTRLGMGLDGRKNFSRFSKIELGGIYSDESARNGDLRGTQIDGLQDPSFDEQRFGGYIKGGWQTASDSPISAAVLSDIHYISDDLFLRELEDERIGERSSRFLTSRLVGRVGISDFASAELSSEYNQSLEEDDDTVQQRLPEFRLSAMKSFRPFGFNPYGLKVVTKGNATITEFSRDEGYDGRRLDLNPEVAVPFHLKNYFTTTVGTGLHYTDYNLSDRTIPGQSGELASSADRTVPYFNFAISTNLERVYELEQGNWLTKLTSLGSANQSTVLKRLKHTIEPIVQYTYVPSVAQDDLPIFDSLDRFRERSRFFYGVKTTLLGRFLPTAPSNETIAELTPTLASLPTFDPTRSLMDFGLNDAVINPAAGISSRRGEIRELATLFLRQSHDSAIDSDDDSEGDLREFSDIGADLGLYPTRSASFFIQSNYNDDDREFTSWAVATSIKDDRDDIIRARYNFVKDGLDQLDGNLEIKISEQLRLGFFGIYDKTESQFVEDRVALRIISPCNCWYVDLGYSDQTNPDKQDLLVNFTFVGLGDIAQGLRVGERKGS